MIFFGTDQADLDCFNFEGNIVKHSKSVNLLGVEIDKRLIFDDHILTIMRIRSYLDIDHAQQVGNTYILTQFNYCNLIWMFCSKTIINQKIDRAHKRALLNLSR